MGMSLRREKISRYRTKTLPLTLTSGHFLQVNRDIVSGLKYVQHTYRTGVKGKSPLHTSAPTPVFPLLKEVFLQVWAGTEPPLVPKPPCATTQEARLLSRVH